MARIRRSIWLDPEWRQLGPEAQLLALCCMTIRTSGPCNDARIARHTGWTRDFIGAYRPELEASAYGYLISDQIKRRRMPVATAQKVFANDNYTCCSCGSLEQLTVDHIVPVSKGGGDEMGNLQTLCRPCNSRKGARL